MTNLNHVHEYNRMMETARKRANELHDEAVTELWSGAGDATLRALRSAARFARTLARHERRQRSVEA